MDQTTRKNKQHRAKQGPIDCPSSTDVLCGRGGHANNHIGNVNFRLLAEKYKQRYSEASRFGKAQVAAEVVDVWRKKGGRFLTRTADNLWEEIQFKFAVKKASQCLRMPLVQHSNTTIAAAMLPNYEASSQPQFSPAAALPQHEQRQQNNRQQFLCHSLGMSSQHPGDSQMFNPFLIGSTISAGSMNSAALVAAAANTSVAERSNEMFPQLSSFMSASSGAMQAGNTKPPPHNPVNVQMSAASQENKKTRETTSGSKIGSTNFQLGSDPERHNVSMPANQFPEPALPGRKRKHSLDDRKPSTSFNNPHHHNHKSRHKGERPADPDSSGNRGDAVSSNSCSSSSRADSDQESKESSRGESDDFESAKESSTPQDTGSSDQEQSSGSSDQGQNSDQDQGQDSDQDSGSCSNGKPLAHHRKRPKIPSAAHSNGDKDTGQSISSSSDITKNVFDEGPTNGSSDDSAMERIMNKSIESFSDTSSESNLGSASRRGSVGWHSNRSSPRARK